MKAMSEKPKAPPMEIQPGSSGWRHMPSPMGSFASVKPKAALAPLAAEVRQAAVARIAEPLQVDTELLARLSDAGVTPGARVDVERGEGVVTVGVPGSGVVLDLPDDVARHIFVSVS